MSENKFEFNYSASEQKELDKIKAKYSPKTKRESKMNELMELDKSTTKGATMISIIVGLIGTLMLGISLTCVTTWTELFYLGLVVGVIGLVLIAVAYPVYLKVVKKKQELVAPTILKLTEEIEKGEYWFLKPTD